MMDNGEEDDNAIPALGEAARNFMIAINYPKEAVEAVDDFEAIKLVNSITNTVIKGAQFIPVEET